MTDRRALIVGYGRAGQRHAKMLDELGIRWVVVEPDITNGPDDVDFYTHLSSALVYAERYQFAVICTPPALHLSQIRQCLDAGLSVLCEKPLCGLGQLNETRELLTHPNANRVMVAYNYRYHQAILNAPRTGLQWMTCWQDRELPEWGLLLDHCSHDLDIVRSIAGEVEVTGARYYPAGTMQQDPKRQLWEIHLKVAGDELAQPIRVREYVGTFPNRKATLEYWDGAEVEITADPDMYRRMWEAFLGGQFEPGLEEAIKTQELLERSYELANENG